MIKLDMQPYIASQSYSRKLEHIQIGFYEFPEYPSSKFSPSNPRRSRWKKKKRRRSGGRLERRYGMGAAETLRSAAWRGDIRVYLWGRTDVR